MKNSTVYLIGIIYMALAIMGFVLCSTVLSGNEYMQIISMSLVLGGACWLSLPGASTPPKMISFVKDDFKRTFNNLGLFPWYRKIVIFGIVFFSCASVSSFIIWMFDLIF